MIKSIDWKQLECEYYHIYVDIEKIISLIKMEEIVISFIYLTLYLIISIIWQIKANLR